MKKLTNEQIIIRAEIVRALHTYERCREEQRANPKLTKHEKDMLFHKMAEEIYGG